MVNILSTFVIMDDPHFGYIKAILINILHMIWMYTSECTKVFDFDYSCDPIEWTLIDEGK